MEWIDYYQKNKPQSNALVAGVLLMVCSGYSIGWGIFNNHLQAQPWAGGYEDEFTVLWAIIVWYIAGIVGFIASTLAINKTSKMSIYTFCSILTGMSSAMLVLRPESIYFIFPARILGGLAHGIAYPTLIIHASEVSVPRLRGMVVSVAQLCLFVGVYTASTCFMPVQQTKEHNVDPTRTIGISGLICVASGVLLAIFFNRESPVYLIKKSRDDEAINMMIRLRSESHETADIRHDFNEFKLMAMEDEKSSLNIFDARNRFPLVIVLMMKVIFVASFNMPLNLIWLEAVETKLFNGINDYSGMYLMGTRWVVIMITMFLIDRKRIKSYMISAGASGFILLLVLYIMDSSPFTSTGEIFDESFAVIVLAFVFQIFSGLAIGQLADVYSAEAFNTRKKPLSIAFTSTVEFLLQILLVFAFFKSSFSLLCLVGVFGLVMALGLFAYVVPDTSNLSLRNARNKFGF